MKKYLLIGLLLLAASAAHASCSNPLSIKDGNAASQSMSIQQGDDGNCQSNQAPQKWYLGASNNGLYASLLTLLSTEAGFNSLANGAVVVSSVGGSSGLFSNSNTGGARSGIVIFTPGSTVTCTGGANLSGWFLQTGDGSTFESTSATPPRSPDFIIPLPAAAIGTTNYNAMGYTTLPALKFKVLLLNNCGVALAASGNLIKVAPVAGQN